MKEFMAQNWIILKISVGTTFTFDLETWFKVSANPLPKSSVYVKYGKDTEYRTIYIRKENICSEQRLFLKTLSTDP